jgi:hypothetical protein
MGDEQYNFKGRGSGRGDGNKARRLDRVRSVHQSDLGHSGSGEIPLGRIVATFSGVRIKSIAADLREIRKGHSEAVSKETILPLVPEDSRVLYGRAIDVMLTIAGDGMTIYDLNEAIIREETLPDGVVCDADPECKYRENSMPPTTK